MKNISQINNTDDSDKLWDNFVAGDMYSFRQIYQLNYQFLYDFGIKYMSVEETEDCIQNLFLYLLNQRKSIARIKDIKSYLFISLRNSIFKQLKKRNKQIQINETEFNIVETDEFSNENLFNQLVKLLLKLSPREHQMVRMKYYHGYRNIEIATKLDIDYQTVRNTLGNAIKKMKAIPNT
jgi:RNA polymerase sigma factor (sigma-70 family)